jgi:rapamycin-insensitive companion of mTOR
VIRDIGLLVAADGLRVLLQSLSDGPHDLSPYIATGLLWTMDRPDSRQSLRPGVDVEVRPDLELVRMDIDAVPQIVLAGFTEIRGKGNLQEERVRTAAKIIMSFVQSWSGESRSQVAVEETEY